MRLQSRFELSVGPAEAWTLLTDLERIAPCMPGIEVETVDRDRLTGVMRVKVGPMSSRYKAEVELVERDRESRRAVLHARGRETRGQGTAKATIVATVADASKGTSVELDTDLAVTGRVAQFGRGLISEVADDLIGQFATRLGELEPTAGVSPPADMPAEVDLGAALASRGRARAIPLLIAAGVVATFWLVLQRRR